MKFTLGLPEPALSVEIFLPRKASYQSKLNAMLRTGLKLNYRQYLTTNRNKIRKFLESYPGLSEGLENIGKRKHSIFNGFSISDVDGVFKGSKNQIDEETTQVIKIIFAPEYDLITKELKKKKEKITRVQLLLLAKEVLADEQSLILSTKGQTKNSSPGAKEIFTEWHRDVFTFLFGYLLREISIITKKNEEEIWLTINRQFSITRVVNSR